MITVLTDGHKSLFPAAEICRLFLGSSVRCDGTCIMAEYPEEIVIESTVNPLGGVYTTVTGTEIFEEPDSRYPLSPNREVKRQLYRIFSKITDKAFPWGSLTGIRPTVVAREAGESGLESLYDVRRDKAGLAVDTARTEDRILSGTVDDDLFVYIGIPFCPGRCSYCSFITQESRASAELLSEYAEAVLREITGLAGVVRNVRAVYFGGGTPTVMDNGLLRNFVNGVLDRICPERDAEITVEAGRADTLDEEKLEGLVSAGVQRICVNPQTLRDRTLLEIGRHHTSDQFFRAYEAARKAGFSSMNTDLIAGLPGENIDDFRFSMDRILSLSPENITVHALSKKRSALMDRGAVTEDAQRGRIADEMIRYAQAGLFREGYRPYYLYKQKDTVGGLENTGFSKPKHECVYNVGMMSDRRSVLSFGAGGVSKRLFPDGSLRRFDCVRNPKEYIVRTDGIIEGKMRFFGV